MSSRNKTLDKVLDNDVGPAIEKAIEKHLGMSINKLKEDITEKVKKNPLVDVEVGTGLSFRVAKFVFRKEYIERILRAYGGDVSAAAKVCGLDRRTIHRMIKDLRIDISECRKNRLREGYLKKEALGMAIGDALKQYKEILHPRKLKELYREVPELSEEILKRQSFAFVTLKNAEREFERAFLGRALDESGWNISRAARAVGLRFETLHRKMKDLGLKKTLKYD